ncbi:MAG: tRNA (adenosine(37)-N6)-threonylcarbamoyltransferase complex ATPase subunit type 1 TsaE [Acidimicrobiales bacterium]
MSWSCRCATAADTAAAGEDFAAALVPGDVVLLTGPLGAGKTTFVQGVARGLGVTERVTSPTFTMVRPHACHAGAITTLWHADLYRVESLDEVWDLALGELVEESGVALVEWGELATSALGRDAWTVQVAVHDDEARVLEAAGARADREAPGRWAP